MRRVISGAVYVAIVTGFFLLKEYVHSRLFTLFIFLLCTAGTIEVAKALQKKTSKSEYVCSIISGSLVVPVYAVLTYLCGLGKYALSLSFLFIFIMMAICVCCVYFCNKKGKTSAVKDVDFRAFYYPSIFLLFMIECNLFYGERDFVALILIFVVSALTDTFAYVTGLLYNKIRNGNAKKLCPKISPKKTVAGAIGGLVGGVVGALVICFVFPAKISYLKLKIDSLLIFALIGLVGAVFTQLGDLFESYIKRSVGIKDMGKVMPGHGGVMDRIDGVLFTSLAIFLIFLLI